MTPVRDEAPKRKIEFKDTISVEDLFLSDSQEEEIVMRPITELERNTVKELMNSRMKPHDMAMKLRDLPHLFNSEEEWKKAVGTLRNINSVIEKTVKDSSNEDTGEREKRLHLVIKDGCPSLEWTWKYAIYEGQEEEPVACRVLYEANDHMSGVNIALTNFDFERQERKALKKMMDETITYIRSFIGNALPCVYVN